jgi:Fe-S-cluster formation regulator IscX/YfhJ
MRTDGQMFVQADRRTDRQTDMTKLIVAFHNFADAPSSETDFKGKIFTMEVQH